MQSPETRGVGALVLGVVSWAVMGSMVKLVSVDGVNVAFWRLWMGFALMALGGLAARRRLRMPDVRASFCAGALFAADVVLFFLSLKRTSVANATLITSMQPLLVMGLAGPLFGERVTRGRVVWALVGLAGVVIVVLGKPPGGASSVSGDLIAVGALVAWAGYFLATKSARRSVGAYEYVTAVLLVSAILTTPIAALSGLRVPRAADWLWLAILVVSGAVGHLLVSWGQRFIDVSLASLIALGVPVTSAAAGWMILGERVSAGQIAGGAVALGAIAMVVREPVSRTALRG